MKTTALSSALCLSILCAAAPAPQWQLELESINRYLLGLTPDGGGQPSYYGRSVAGDFDGDLQQDAFILRGKTAEILFAPGLYDALVPNVGSAIDMATLHRPGGDAVLLVGDGGLQRWGWNAATQTAETTLIEGTHWIDARRIVLVDRGGGAPIDVYGLMADRHTFRRLSNVAQTPQEVLLFTAAEEVLDFAVVDTDGDGALEIVAMVASGLRVFDPEDPAAVPLRQHDAAGGTSVAIVPVRMSFSDAVWIAWAVRVGTTDILVRVGPNGLLPRTTLGSWGLVAMSAGDHDNDGNDDLLLSYTSALELALLTNMGDTSVPQFGLDETVPATGYPELERIALADQQTPAPSNRAWPLFVDVDFDGDRDICFPIQSLASLAVIKRFHVDHEAMQPFMVMSEEEAEATIDENRQVVFDVTIPPGTPAGANYLELVAWRKPDPATLLQAHSILNMRLSIDQADVGTARTAQFDLSGETPMAGEPASFTSIIFWTQRFIAAPDFAQNPTAVYPGKVYVMQAMGAGDGNPNEAFVAALPAGGEFFELEDAVPGEPLGGDGLGTGRENSCVGGTDGGVPVP